MPPTGTLSAVHREIKETCPIEPAGQELLEQIFETLKLSARSFDRIIKVSRTIADLAQADTITAEHLAEAVSYRNTLPKT